MNNPYADCGPEILVPYTQDAHVCEIVANGGDQCLVTHECKWHYDASRDWDCLEKHCQRVQARLKAAGFKHLPGIAPAGVMAVLENGTLETCAYNGPDHLENASHVAWTIRLERVWFEGNTEPTPYEWLIGAVDSLNQALDKEIHDDEA